MFLDRKIPTWIPLLAVSWTVAVRALPAKDPVQFVDVTTESGLQWVHDNGMSPRRLLPETMNGGGAFLDYDGDGWLDIYLVTGSTTDFYKPAKPRTNALYRNNRNGTFTDVTEKAGVPGRGFGMGVAAADYDNDGDTDLLVTDLTSAILYRNQGDGTFREATREAGIDVQGWSAGAAWFDYDRDGKLDLWVCGYVIWRPELNGRCGGGETPRYCIPTLFDGWASWLFRNKGDGTFEDVSKKAGIADPKGKGLGVVAADINNDGWMDVFQSNDTVENFLYKNNGDGTFDEIGLMSGVAFSPDGRTRSGMGVDAQDFDDDGKVDLFVANIDNEDVSVYRNLDGESFEDSVQTDPEMAQATRFMSTFGARFLDYDNDGDHDLVVVNGHPDDQIDYHRGNIHYKEKPQLFENVLSQFNNVSAESGPAFQQTYAGRGLATGDYDNDGDLDLLFVNNGEKATLLKNQGGNTNSWVGLHLVGQKNNRDGVGSILSYTVSGIRRFHFLAGGSSYQSSHDPRVLLGFGTQTDPGAITVRWPNGEEQVLEGLQSRRYYEVREGGGAREIGY